jgi:putative phosphotransacetylase
VKIEGPRALTFENVEVRVDEDFEAAIHLDTDEANAAGIDGAGEGEIIK